MPRRDPSEKQEPHTVMGKNTVKRRIFCWSAAYLGAMLAYLGAMLAYLEGNMGASWGYVGPSWGLGWPILGLCWPILGLSWPILGLCCPMLRLCRSILRPMLAHVDPSLSHKGRKSGKKGKSTKHRKTREFLATRGGSAAGAAAPLSYGEERTAVRQGHGQGAPGRIKGLRPLSPTPGHWRVMPASVSCPVFSLML